MCAFVGIGFVLLVYFLGTLLSGGSPSSNTATGVGSKSLSFDSNHLTLYVAIIWISVTLLINIINQTEKTEDLTAGKSVSRCAGQTYQGSKAAAVVFIAAVLIFLVWSWGHDDSPPLSVEFRHSYIGKGYVMIVKNKSQLPMYNIRLKIGSSTSAENWITDTLAPSASKEIGWMQLSNGKLDNGEVTYVYARGYGDPVVSYVY